MPMVPLTLQADILAIFIEMNNMSQDGNAYKATEMAKAVKEFILTGQVAPADTGAAPAGAYTGAGIGTMAIDSDVLMDDLLTTFEAKYTNDGLAEHIATDIDKACKEDGVVKITSTGTVTTGTGPISFSGPGEGKLVGDKTIISSALKACFTSMNGMTTGGNEYYAAQFAAAVYAYLTAGAINVTLKSPFVSGSGSPSIERLLKAR